MSNNIFVRLSNERTELFFSESNEQTLENIAKDDDDRSETRNGCTTIDKKVIEKANDVEINSIIIFSLFELCLRHLATSFDIHWKLPVGQVCCYLCGSCFCEVYFERQNVYPRGDRRIRINQHSMPLLDDRVSLRPLSCCYADY